MLTVQSECGKENAICKFHLDISHALTMMISTKTKVFAENGNLYKYDVTNTSSATPIPTDEIISADGWPEARLVTVANGQMPGPTITVWEGQRVIVDVTNNLETRDVTIHWHGIHQLGSPWMDGVPYITQCPISPSQSFRYDFVVKQTGTFWWHSHAGRERSNGLYGAFVVKPREQDEAIEEYVFTIQDWNHSEDADLAGMKDLFYDGHKVWTPFKTYDGQDWGNYRIHSALLNGRGRFRHQEKGTVIDSPVETFNVTSGKRYRFRVINAATFYAFRVSIDDHEITIVASDGSDIQPVVCESFAIFPGERYDFIITADRLPKSYWIRAQAMLDSDYVITAEAVLQYANVLPAIPTTTRNCKAFGICKVFNCPFLVFPEPLTICLPLGSMKGLNRNPVPRYEYGNFVEHFLSFGFVNHMATVNGKKFKSPDVNIYSQPKGLKWPCDLANCTDFQICSCTHTLNIPMGATVQLVFANYVQPNGKYDEPHPIHLHGHSFYVIKVGFGVYTEDYGKVVGHNADLTCNSAMCNRARWTNNTWTQELPGADLETAPLKVNDTHPRSVGIWKINSMVEITLK